MAGKKEVWYLWAAFKLKINTTSFVFLLLKRVEPNSSVGKAVTAGTDSVAGILPAITLNSKEMMPIVRNPEIYGTVVLLADLEIGHIKLYIRTKAVSL